MKQLSKRFAMALALIAMLYTVNATGALAQDSSTAVVQSAQVQGPDAEQIVGGQPADPGEYPWQAMVATASGEMFCGGSLIHPNWVLTAAHCLEEGDAGKVILGAHQRANTGETTRQVINIRRYLIHPNYNGNTTDQDIGLIELATPAVLNARVATVAYVTGAESTLFAPGVLATVTGWGATRENGALATVLMEVQIPIVSNATCRQSYGSDVTNNMMCAGLQEGGKDSCQGDSGGPLIVPSTGGDVKLAGIVSWGNGCARANNYGVYTRVANYTGWIAQTIGTTHLPTPMPTTPTPPTATPVAPTLTPTVPTSTPTPTPTTPAPDGTLAVKNGNFDFGPNGDWREWSSRGYGLIETEAPIDALSGNYLAWLAGDNWETSRLFQRVHLPSGPLYLNFSYAIDAAETNCGVDLGRVYLGKTRIKQYQLCTSKVTDSWVQTTIDISAYAGQTLNLQFYAKTDKRRVSNFYIENVSITTTPPNRSAVLIESPEAVEDGEAEEQMERIFLPLVSN